MRSLVLHPLSMVVFAASVVFSQNVSAQELKPEELYEQILPSVMTLKIKSHRGDHYTGSGFLAFAPGLGVTSWHVIHDAKEVTAHFSDGQTAEVTGLVDRDINRDLALIRLKTEGRPLARFATIPPRIGARTYVIGAPRGYAFSISDGLLSQVQTIDGFPQYQVSCPLSTGNSGGPLLNGQGEVIGIASWTKTDAQNVNFAIPSTQLMQLDPARPAIAWNEVPKTGRPEIALTAAPEPVAQAETKPDPRLAAFRSFLKTASGKEITITVQEGANEQRFSFVVPE